MNIYWICWKTTSRRILVWVIYNLAVSSFVIAIALVSTFMHAGRNFLARNTRSESEFYKKMLIITLLVGFRPAVLSELRTGAMTPLAWACVIAPGISAAFYLFGPAKAIRASDFAIVYPEARALFIAFINVTRGRYLTLAGWMGII